MTESLPQYSIAQARDHLTQLVHTAEQGISIGITRRGKRVAVILSAEEYDRLASTRLDFWTSLVNFRERLLQESIDIDPDEVFEGVKDKSSGREVNL